MARKKRIVGWHDRHSGVCTEDVVETFTHKQQLADGRVIFADPANRFWRFAGCSWYGEPPAGWNPAEAVECVHTRSYTTESDYS